MTGHRKVAGGYEHNVDDANVHAFPGAEPRHPDDPGPGEPGRLKTAEPGINPLGSWAPLDLGPYLRGTIQRPEPSVGIARSDGLRLLYPGKEHTVFGEMECGKSWVLSASALAELLAGNHVSYLHFEEADPSDTVERLLALGAPPHLLTTRLRFFGPEDRVTPLRLAAVLEQSPTLVILDGVNEAMALHGLAINDVEGAADFRRLLVKPCTATGAATLAADHVAKSLDGRPRTAIGSVHKGNGLTGVQIQLENVEAFGRGMRGRSHVYVTKDRSGHLRRHGKPDRSSPGKFYLGELVVDDTQTQTPDLELAFYAWRKHEASDNDTKDTSPTAADNVLTALSTHGGTADTVTELRAMLRDAGTGMNNTALQDVLADLKLHNRIVEVTKGQKKGYRLATTGSEVTAP